MAHATCLVCLISTVSGGSKKAKNAFEDVALVAGTWQTLSYLYSLDIYAWLSLVTTTLHPGLIISINQSLVSAARC